MNARLLVSVIAVAGLVLTGAGCGEKEEVGSETSSLMSPAVATDASPPIPSISELESSLDLNADQRDALESALAKWQESVPAEMCGAGRGGMRGGRGGKHAGRAEFGHGPERADGESPFLGFLETSVSVLEADQFVKLTEFLAEQRESCRGTRSGRRGLGHRGGSERGPRGHAHGLGDGLRAGLDDLVAELELTDEQESQLRAALEAHHEAMRTFHEENMDSGLDREAIRERAQELRDELRTELENILEPEQLAQMDELREQHRAEMREQHQARGDQRMDRRLEFLTRILSLDESQEQQVQDLMETAAEQHRALRQSTRDGEIEHEDAMAQMEQMHEELAGAIRNLLTPEQQTVFDALQNLHPVAGRGIGWGHGRDPWKH